MVPRGRMRSRCRIPRRSVRGKVNRVADGAYGTRTISTATSSTTTITIAKATVADHGTSTGWVDTMGRSHRQATFIGGVNINTSYVAFDGQTGGGPGNWETTGHGLYVFDDDDVMYCDPGTHDITVKHVEIAGHGPDGVPAGVSNDGFWVGCDNLTANDLYLHDFGRCILFSNSRHINVIFEYSYFGRHDDVW